MCNQPDYKAHMGAFDDALVELFRRWSATVAEYIDGADIGPQDWGQEFIEEITRRLPELKKRPEYVEMAKALDALAGPPQDSAGDRLPCVWPATHTRFRPARLAA